VLRRDQTPCRHPDFPHRSNSSDEKGEVSICGLIDDLGGDGDRGQGNVRRLLFVERRV